ncbi:hypothetical protein ACP6PL_03350 [Dapis sp. BLCC M126]|uniref:hypothetical protein n=1 Tax=Dapis sp. BLCC M126 TaxID=3400189 RepID=UPI003CEB3AD6
MDGELWQFGKLVSDEFTKSKLRITITDLDKIFGTIIKPSDFFVKELRLHWEILYNTSPNKIKGPINV